jgi:hypothetical protein
MKNLMNGRIWRLRAMIILCSRGRSLCTLAHEKEKRICSKVEIVHWQDVHPRRRDAYRHPEQIHRTDDSGAEAERNGLLVTITLLALETAIPGRGKYHLESPVKT